MPHIAVELDALNVTPDVAGAAGISDSDALAGLVRTWAYCFRAQTDIVTTGQLAGFFRSGTGEKVAAALVAFGFLEALEDGWRVRGADRYLRLTTAVQEGRRKGGLAAKKHLVPGPKPRNPAEDSSRRASRSEAEGKPKTPSAEPRAQNPSAKSPAEGQPKDSAEGQAEEPFGFASASVRLLSPNTEHRTPNTVKEAATAEEKAPDENLVELVENLYHDATGQTFAWDPFPNGPEERALRSLWGQHGNSLPALLAAAFDPAFPTYASLADLERGGAGALNKLRAKAAKAKAANPDRDVGRRATVPFEPNCARCDEPADGDVWGQPLCARCRGEWLEAKVGPSEAATVAWVEKGRTTA